MQTISGKWQGQGELIFFFVSGNNGQSYKTSFSTVINTDGSKLVRLSPSATFTLVEYLRKGF